jgi:AcrR family transcriptional regulator
MAAARTLPPDYPTAEADDEGDRPSRVRASALPAAQRRAEIIAATLPLLLAHGPAVTTRQIAEAAGVAEGTIFRVFPTKEILIDAVVESALDMTSIDSSLGTIDPALPLEGRLIAAVDILRRRFADILQLKTAVESMSLAGRAPSMADRRHPTDLSGLAAVFEADRHQLRRDPLEAAYLLRGMTITGTHPALILDQPLSSAEIVSLFLDGTRLASASPVPPSADRGAARC